MIDLHSVGLTIAGMIRAMLPIAAVAAIVLVIQLAVRLAGVGDFRRRIERKRLMTPAEVRFWRLLNAALPEYRIFGQVAMGALLKPVSGLSRKDWWSTYGRFSQKIVDFAVIEPVTGEVVAIVELDDSTHDSPADADRDALLARGGYTVVRFQARSARDVGEVRARFACMDLYGRGPVAWRPRAVS